MNIKTGYFSYTKKYEEMGYLPVSIALSTPKWFDGIKTRGLSPNGILLGKFRNKEITEDEFKLFYLAGLNQDVINVYVKSWQEYLNFNPDCVGIVLLCYEKPKDTCHRHYFAEHLNKIYGFDVTELQVVKA